MVKIGGISHHQDQLKRLTRHVHTIMVILSFFFFSLFNIFVFSTLRLWVCIYMFIISSFRMMSKPHKSSLAHDDPSCLPIIRVPGDGRCLFRSVAYGACLRSGDPSPSHSKQKQLADDLRNKVVDEFIKRKADTEWFLEGDFDTYTGQMRKPHIWGGEPELLMSSHVLRMPIRVVMQDQKSGSVKIIAEYGEEYGKDYPIQVIYHGYGHYDVLQTSPASTYTRTIQIS